MEIVNAAAPVVVGFFLALVGIVLLWRGVVQPDALAKMEAMSASNEARMDRLRASLDNQQNELDELRAELLSDREEMAEMKMEMAEWRRGMALNFEQMRAANLTPVWQPRPREHRPRRADKRVEGALVSRIARQFNIGEMNGLAYDMGIETEELAGDTRDARARELVEMAYRRGFSAALVARVNELRSDE